MRTAVDPEAGLESVAPVVQYWDSEEVPADVAELLATFRDGDPSMTHLLFNERTAEELIDEHLTARELAAFRSCAVPAMQADYFRYCAVYALGGVYVDADFGFRRSLRPLLDAEGQLFERPPLGPVLPDVFAFRSPGHPLLALTIEVATRNIERRLSDNVALTTGPAIFTSLRQLQRSDSVEALRPLRELIRPEWRADLDACWEELVDSILGAVAERGPIDAVFEGVRVSPRAEMLTWVERQEAELPYKRGEDHWPNWGRSIFRQPDDGPPPGDSRSR
jgi:Glycosyltransferase sugar-binding region containing DXD motif